MSKTIYFRTKNWDTYRIDSHGNKFKNGKCINDIIGTLGEIHSTPLPHKNAWITTPVFLPLKTTEKRWLKAKGLV